ncbi:hypothetical protein [Streptomyces sp. NPDC060322]|uniref:hypothetical protein n=1 Tax=Streptomyces sp. NPDC060322 TaxID=3347097 RepID=UPI00364741D5
MPRSPSSPARPLDRGRWNALRYEQPEERPHPEQVVTVDRAGYYGQQAVERFRAAHQGA